MASGEKTLTKPVPPLPAVIIIVSVIILLFGPPAIKTRKASQQAAKAKERYNQGLKKAAVIVKKFNKETGHNVKTIQQITALMRKEGWYSDKATDSWKKRTENTMGLMLRDGGHKINSLEH